MAPPSGADSMLNVGAQLNILPGTLISKPFVNSNGLMLIPLTHTWPFKKLDGQTKRSSAVAEMGDRGHNRYGPKRGGAAVPLSRELGPRLAQCGLGQGLLLYQAASSSIQPFGHNRHGPKIGWGGCALFSNVGDFVYKTFRLLDTSPTTWTLRLLDISPTGQFAY